MGKQTMDSLIKAFKTHSGQCEKPLTDEAKVRAYHSKVTRSGDIAGKFWERVWSDLDEKGIKRAIEILDSNTTANVKRQFAEFDAGKLREKLSELKTSVKNVRLKIIYDTEVDEMRKLLYKDFPETIEKLMTQPSTPDELRKINNIRDSINLEEMANQIAHVPVSYTHLTLPTTPYV
eukprot:TRINITY_DN15004_c0_g1_i1.p1 TRINITY_DN15004_c0_g1~~TRINITY_DN15004_c0_g1_i1.p1  ORF type:complete len:177 (+),score=59.19 TRINITY_DN15004_c0_g1_i1:110-640(+)